MRDPSFGITRTVLSIRFIKEDFRISTSDCRWQDPFRQYHYTPKRDPLVNVNFSRFAASTGRIPVRVAVAPYGPALLHFKHPEAVRGLFGDKPRQKHFENIGYNAHLRGSYKPVSDHSVTERINNPVRCRVTRIDRIIATSVDNSCADNGHIFNFERISRPDG